MSPSDDKKDEKGQSWLKGWLPNTSAAPASNMDDSVNEAGMAEIVMMSEAENTQSAPSPRKSSRKLALLLMAGAIFSKGLGFVREIAMAHVFGASIVADAFRASITGALIPVAMLQNESVPTVLIPMHREAQASGNAPRHFAALVVSLTAVALIIVALVLAFLNLVVSSLVSGFSPEASALTRQFLGVMALGAPGSVMLNVLASGEIALGRSRLTTLRASLLNISVILGLLIVVLTQAYLALAWGFVLAFDGLAIWGLLTLTRDGSLDFSGLSFSFIVSIAQEFWRRVRPLLGVTAAEQANTWFERRLASQLAVGAVASLDYARTITESAVLFVSQPLGLVLLSSTPTTDYDARMQAISRPLLAVILPASVCLWVFAPDVARVVFSRGAFDETAVLLTSQAIRGIAIGLWATTLGWILLRMLNSVGRNVVAALILVAAYAVNIGANYIFSQATDLHDHGPLLLGVGETLRGFVLLSGTLIALRCVQSMAKILMLAAIPSAVMAGLAMCIQAAFTGSLLRLMIAGFTCILVVVFGGFVLARPQTMQILRKLSQNLRQRREGE